VLKKDVSCVQRAGALLPEYQKGIRYRGDEFEPAEIEKREKELAECEQEKITRSGGLKWH